MERASRNYLILPEINPKIRQKNRSLSKEKISTEDKKRSKSKEKPQMKDKVKLSPYQKMPISLKKKIPISNSTNSISNSLDFSSSLQFEYSTQHLLEKLSIHGVPEGVIKTYSELTGNTEDGNVRKFIVNEISELNNNSAVILQCVKAYKAWKDSLGTVREMATFLGNSPGWIKLKDVVNECSSSLSTHILLTLNLIELVLSWKEYVRGFVRRQELFMCNDQDVFEEVKTACDFLVDSPLNPAFNLSKNDPLLLNVLKESAGSKKQSFNFTVEKGKIYIYLDKKVIDRLKKVLTLISKQEEEPLPTKSPEKLSIFKKKQNKSEDLKKIAKLFSDRILIDHLNTLLQELIKDQITDEFSILIQSKILSQLTNESLQEIVNLSKMEISNEIGSKKAHKLHLLNIIEAIVRNLIEEEIKNADLHMLCEDLINNEIQSEMKNVRNTDAKRRLTRITMNFEVEKQSELIYNDLLDEYINEDMLTQLAESCFLMTRKKTIIPLVINNKHVEEAEDNVLEVFTPGAHSPNEVRSEKSDEEESPLKVQEVENPKKMFSNIAINMKLARIEPLNEDPLALENAILEYFEQLPKEFESTLDPAQILEQAGKMCDSQFFWLSYDGNACGFYCYSLRSIDSIVVHHISCLNYKIFEEFLGHFVDLAGLSASEVIIQYKPSVLSSKPLQNSLKSKNFKKSPGNSAYTEFMQKPNKPPKTTYSFKLLSLSALETKNSAEFNKLTCPEMVQLGNRHSILSLILPLLPPSESLSPRFDDTPIRLQQDLNELLEIIFSLSFKSYPIFSTIPNPTSHQINQICSDFSIKPLFSHLNPSICSLLNLDFSLFNLSFVTFSHSNSNYKYLRFSQTIVSVRIEDSSKMFIIPTNNPEISLFFIDSPSIKRELAQGLKVGKTDLFYNIDNLIKALQEEENATQALWVPCFEKTIQMKVPWVEGYTVSSQGNNVVSGCAESFRASFTYNGPSNKSLRFAAERKSVIQDDFVFGVYSKQVQSTLDSPFYVVLVTKDDYVKVN